MTRPKIRPIKCGSCHKAKGDSIFINSVIAYIIVGGTFKQTRELFTIVYPHCMTKQIRLTVQYSEKV